MKRQFLMGESGFTLFELMIVISMLVIFFVWTLSFNWNPRTEQEKWELLAISIAWRLREEIQNIAIGKMPKRDGNIAKTTIIDISTGWLITRYYSGTTLIDTKSFVMPFFEWDRKYVIKWVTWSGSATVATGWRLIIEPTGISFSWSPTTIKDNIILEIRVWYNLSSRKIIIDKRTGKISEKKQ